MSDSNHPDYSGTVAILLIVVHTVLDSLAVLIRFWFRMISITKLWWDDWLALIDLAICYGQAGAAIFWVHIGLGKHPKNVSPAENITSGLKMLYAEYVLFELGISVAKLSVLCFYARIFRVNKRFSTAL
ncbi:uncharacterized protein BP5553_05102 [Venustampulla echinocandica]|uniref:Rhodopsin domain-containing protein n=1 Tax=Venustampulla echinocandica TaxID=2656787 RepID=A0A370TQ70_9HELO|nr:uncharacterized protein BP5553_05102 [Venustampulla echinocandica]RDL37669.1 hypothetical protein BP5553_05102 [Venustampulla echinocandica]